jgi:hypothetical protein
VELERKEERVERSEIAAVPVNQEEANETKKKRILVGAASPISSW